MLAFSFWPAENQVKYWIFAIGWSSGGNRRIHTSWVVGDGAQPEARGGGHTHLPQSSYLLLQPALFSPSGLRVLPSRVIKKSKDVRRLFISAPSLDIIQ